MDKKNIDDIKKMPFEKALDKLEKTVGEMESGNLPLEAMMEKFEEGQLLASACSEKLKMAEKKIETLKKNSGSEPQWTSYDEDESVNRNAPSDTPTPQEDSDSLF